MCARRHEQVALVQLGFTGYDSTRMLGSFQSFKYFLISGKWF